jgi:hypothetical protein
MQPYQNALLGAAFGQVFPGAANPSGATPSIAGMPSGLNQSVAPFTPTQNAALALGNQQVGTAQSLANLGAGTQGLYASGAMLNPSSNPYLAAYGQQAATQDVLNYQLGTQPALAAQFQQMGAFDSSGYNQAQGLAQYGLGQSLATLGAGIYEPAFQQQSANQLSAAQNIPSSALPGLFMPSATQFGIGGASQQQQQNVLNTATQNAAQQANWPFALLSQFGGALQQAGMGAGTTVSTGPASMMGK